MQTTEPSDLAVRAWPEPLRPGWEVRRANLTDVPAVARLVDGPRAGELGVAAETARSAARLVLAHYGLEHGEVWVAVDAAGVVRAAVVRLPADSAEGAQAVARREAEHALHLQLGLSPEDLERLRALPA